MNFLAWLQLIEALVPTVQTIVTAIHPNDVSEQQKIATGSAVLHAITATIANPPVAVVPAPVTPVAVNVPQSIAVAAGPSPT